MKPKNFISLAVFVIILVNCTAVKTDGQGSLQPLVATLTPAIGAQAFDTDESLAEAMMQVFPDNGSVDFKIVGDKFFQSGKDKTFEFVETSSGVIASLDGLTDVSNGVYRAFTACEHEHCQERLFVENLQNGEIFEITFSTRMPWRPIDRLTWIDDHVLAFGQSSNPHYGFRFAIDVNQMQHLLTLVVADECFTSEDCG